MEHARPSKRRTTIAAHLIHVLYGHWGANDPRGSNSLDLYDEKFEPLGAIHHGRKPEHLQPSRGELREYHRRHEELLNFPLFWIDDAKAQAIASAIGAVVRERGYTCYACAVCSNHTHLVIRTHKDHARTMWDHFAEGMRTRLRLCLGPSNGDISSHHPVISARPFNALLYTADQVRACIEYVKQNPIKEGLPVQRWEFVTAYDGWPFHKVRAPRRDAEAHA